MERDRIGFEVSSFQAYCYHTVLKANDAYHFPETLPLGPFLLCLYLIALPKGPIQRDRI